MRKLLTGSAAALALAAVTLGAAAPAQARWHGGYGGHGGYYSRGYYGHYHGGGRTAAVVGAGILGLAAGAAIASSPRYYDYDYGPSYYAPPPPPPGYYYGGPYCRSDWRWDGWARRYVRVSYCD
jgi:hypothetical protein